MSPSAAIAVRGLALVVLGTGVGVGNHLLRAGQAVTEATAEASCEPPEVVGPVVGMNPEDAAALCTQSGVVVLDVRPAPTFAEGHVAGAIHLPCRSGALAEALHDRLSAADTVILYGDEDTDPEAVAKSLMQRQVSQVKVIQGGYPAWADAGLACSSGPCADCEQDAHSHGGDR